MTPGAEPVERGARSTDGQSPHTLAERGTRSSQGKAELHPNVLDSRGTAELPPTPPAGISDEEAEGRRGAGLGNTPPPPTTRTYGQIIRENVFTFVNNILFILGLALVLVGRPFDALVSLGVISTNIVVGIVQEVRAKRTLDRIALLTRPTANVVRAGVVRAISPDELVVGDLVEVGPGDQIVLDGQLFTGRVSLDESQLTGESDVVPKRPGDAVYSGSYATSGTGRFVVQKVQGASLANQITAGARSYRRVLTPLQSEVNLVIRVVLGIVIYLELLLVLNSLLKLVPAGQAVAEATVLAGLVPNGLFVSIAIAYALGAIRILRFGALVQQSNAIESLSHVDVLCLDKTGTLTANRLAVDTVAPIEVTEAELKTAVAVVAASATARNKTTEAIAAAFPAGGRPLAGEIPFSSARKWSAVAFGSDGLSTAGPSVPPAGTYAIGAPQFLRRYLAEAPQGGASSWAAIEARVHTWADKGLRVLLVAFHPDPAAIGTAGADEDGTLPAGMRPLGMLALRDELRPEAGAILERFLENGVSVKIISGDDPDTVVALARQAGFSQDLPSTSGSEIAALSDVEVGTVASETTVFGRITPDQKERLIDALRARGHYVAMIGDGVNDVLSLKKANLGIAMGSGSQATRGVADLILMDDSFAAVGGAVEEGQRILNGMQDILRLFLARIMTLGLVIVSSLVIGFFPIELRNASALTFFTVGIPSALLAVWAHSGRRTRETLARTLARFVIPASAVSSLAALLVFYGTLVLAGPTDAAGVATSLPDARTALTTFLVLTGLLLVVFVEPPVGWFAVVEPQTRDRRPTILAGILVIAYALVLLAPAGREFFSLVIPGPRELLLVGLVLAGWLLTVRTFWRYELIERFIGLSRSREVSPPTREVGSPVAKQGGGPSAIAGS